MHDPNPMAKNDEGPSSLPSALAATPPTSQLPEQDSHSNYVPALLHALLANTHTQIAYLDPQFNFVQVNDAYIQASGHTRQELIGHNHFALFPNAENQAIFDRVRDTGEPVAYQDKPFEFVDQPERGTTYWDWSLVPVKDQDGSVQGLLLQIQDVTARHREQAALRESEEKYRQIVETAGEGIWLCDAQQRTSYVNKRLTEMLGYRPEEMIGKFSYDFVPPEAKPLAYQYHEQRLQGYRGPVEQRFVRQDGTILWALSSATKLLDTAGNLIGFLGMVTDITDRKRVEEQRAKELEAIQQLQSVSLQLLSEENPQFLYAKILDTAIALVKSDMGSFQLFDAERDELQLLAWRGFHPESAAFWRVVPNEGHTVCRAAQASGQRVVVPDIKAADFLMDSPSNKFLSENNLSSLWYT